MGAVGQGRVHIALYFHINTVSALKVRANISNTHLNRAVNNLVNAIEQAIAG